MNPGDNDLIRRGDALNAIRKMCILDHLPFRSNTPEGQRAMEALMAIRKVPSASETSDVVSYSCDTCGNRYTMLCDNCTVSLTNPRPLHWFQKEEDCEDAMHSD